MKPYSEKNGIEVIRTLKIIELMLESNVISYKEAIKACKLLNDNPATRIPKLDIDNFIKKLEKDTVQVRIF